MITRRSRPHLVVVADLGPSRLRVAALVGGRLGKVATHPIAEFVPPTDDGRPVDPLPGIVRALLGTVPPGERADLVGIGVDAHVDGRGRISGARPAGLADGGCLREAIESALCAPVLVDNATSLAALGEARQGAGRGRGDVALLLLDEEITIGIVSGGRIVRGAHGAAGEAGLMLLPAHRGVTGRDADARVPRIGAAITEAPTGYARLNELAGGAGLARIFTDGTRPLELRPEIADRRGKAAARQAIEGWALLIADVACLFDPDVLVLGGGLIATAPGLLEPLRRRVEELMTPDAGIVSPEIRLARLGPRAALIGASIAARVALNTGTLRSFSSAPQDPVVETR